jgi:hypothetical protein
MNNSPSIYLAKAQTIIDKSLLSKSDKEMISVRMTLVPLELIESFIVSCEKDPSFLFEVVKNLKAKIDAGDDLNKLHEIMKQERIEVELENTMSAK